MTPSFETHPTPTPADKNDEKTKVLEKIASYRKEVVDRLKSKKGFYLPHALQHGDDMLFRAAYWKVLEKLCVEEGISPDSIIISEDDDTLLLLDNLSFSIEYDGRKAGLFPESTKVNTHYQQDLLRFSRAVGVELTPEEFNGSPAVRKSEHGPLALYDEQRVSEKAEKLKNEFHGRKVIVLSQSGSTIDKRYTDEQLIELAEAIKEKQKDAVIIVLSDKPLLREAVAGMKRRLNGKSRAGFPVATDVTISETYTPEQVQRFADELAGSIVASEDNKIDRVVETDDINEVLAYLRIAQEGVFTDGYWMHLGKSQNIPEMYALFTLFKPEWWAAPGVVAVESDALVSVDPYQQGIDYMTYHQDEAFAAEPRSESDYGIEKKDVQKMIGVVGK